MENSKWIATIASIWIQCVSGSSYAFGIYSSLLKSTQKFNQSTLDTVSVFKDIGANAGVLSGLLYSHGSPSVVLLAGVIQCFSGYFFLWAAVTGIIPRPPVAATCLFIFLAAHAQTFFNTANVVIGVRNFPSYGGTIVGIMKGFLGLSGPILIQVYHTFCNGNPGTFLLVLSLLPSIIILALMCLVRTHQINTPTDKNNLDRISAIAVLVAGYLMIIIIIQNIIVVPGFTYFLTFFILLFLLSLPMLVVNTERNDSRLRLLNHDEDRKHEEEEGISISQAVCSINFWLLFISMACGMGSGLATINNISQIGESLNYTHLEISTLVSLWGIWNFLGRFGAGYISDILIHRKGLARPSLMAATLASMTVGHFIIASGIWGNLYVGSVLVGVCYGSQWSLMPTITSEIFGVRHMGTIFNAVAAASPVGSYILSVRVVGFLYDREAEEGSCYGRRCFMISFFILGCGCILGSLAALALYIRTKEFYSGVVIRKLQESQEG